MLTKLELLDFGASREFPQQFIDDYLAILKAGANLDREQCRAMSLRLGYLTGRETEVPTLICSIVLKCIVHVERAYRFRPHIGRTVLRKCARGLRLLTTRCHDEGESADSDHVAPSIDTAAKGDIFVASEVKRGFLVLFKNRSESSM